MKSFASQREILEIAIVSKDRQCFEGSASLIILPKSPSGQYRTLRPLVVVVPRTEATIAWREALVADILMSEFGPSC